MVHFWAKLLTDQKIMHSATVKRKRFLPSEITQTMQQLCYELDIPTPIILVKHMSAFEKYHLATFTPEDFVEQVSFEKMVIQVY